MATLSLSDHNNLLIKKMNKNRIVYFLNTALCALFILGATNIHAQSETQFEIVLVMSHSQSMSTSDPDKLARVAALELVESLDNSVKLGLIYFDKNTNIVSPLNSLGESRKTLLTYIAQFKSDTLQSNSPEALQRALEMFQGSDSDASIQRSIIFLSDQPVNTGDATQDQEKRHWLTNDFSSAAVQKGVKIFTISLTDNADQTLSKTLANNTSGQFYAANSAQELLGVFRKINTKITGQSISISPTNGVSINTLTGYDASFSPISEGEEEGKTQIVRPENTSEQSTLFPWSIVLVIGALIAGLLFLVFFKNRERPSHPSINAQPIRPAATPEAYLEDIHRVTLRKHLDLGSSSTILGRVAGDQSSKFHYIEIDQKTISREHTVIEYRDSAFYINDKNSANGTFVNDIKIEQWQRLNHLDKVRLDKYEFIFTLPTILTNNSINAASPEALLEDATIINTQSPKIKTGSKPERQQDDEDAPTIFMATPKKKH